MQPITAPKAVPTPIEPNRAPEDIKQFFDLDPRALNPLRKYHAIDRTKAHMVKNSAPFCRAVN